MSRIATKITLDEFKKLCLDKLFIGHEDFEPYENLLENSVISKDLSKVDFDMENYQIGNANPSFKKYPEDHISAVGYPTGYEVLSNGLPVLFVSAGGDWQFPICFCIYYDGDKLRAYIPSDGNAWNKKEKCAYEPEEDNDDNVKFIKECDADKIRQDIINRIKIK
jgi:hypothetical protein